MRNRRSGAPSPARVKPLRRQRQDAKPRRPIEAEPAHRSRQHGRRRRRIRRRHPDARTQAQRSAAARAARSPRQAAARARHAGDRRAARSARPHPERGACRAAAFPAPAQANGAKTVLVITGKGGDRRGASAACSSARCRCGWRCRNSARLVVGFERRRHRPRRRGRALCAGAAVQVRQPRIPAERRKSRHKARE